MTHDAIYDKLAERYIRIIFSTASGNVGVRYPDGKLTNPEQITLIDQRLRPGEFVPANVDSAVAAVKSIGAVGTFRIVQFLEVEEAIAFLGLDLDGTVFDGIEDPVAYWVEKYAISGYYRLLSPDTLQDVNDCSELCILLSEEY